MSLYEICIKRPVFTVMLIMSLVVLGLASLRDLGVDLFPKVDIPTITITTRLEGASPEEIESQITKRIEEAVNTISGIDELRSTTIEGQSQIFATFLLEKNVDVAANEVREKVSTILGELPSGSDPPVIEKFDPDSAPVMSIVVLGARMPREITEIADKKIKRQLEVVKNVGAISIVGGRKREIRVLIDPSRLSAYNLSIQSVKNALRRQNVEVPGGRITWEAREEGIRTMGRIERVEDFSGLIVADYKGAPLTIKDLGRVEDGEEEARSLSRLNGKSAVSLFVRKQSGTNTVEVVRLVKEKMAELKASLPPDIRMEVVTDQSRFIEKSVSQVEEHLVLGGILASFIILLFIRDWRTALISAVAIPVSIVGTFTALRFMNFTLNNMTLLALSVCTGIVIDDAIIVVENIFRHMDEEKRSPVDAAIHGTKEIALAVMATTLSLVVIFLPVAFMSGLVGRFWKSFGLTATFAIMISLFVAFTLTPMLSSLLLKPKTEEEIEKEKKGSPSYRLLERAYLKALHWCLTHRAMVVIAAALILFSVVPLGRVLKTEFIVDDDTSEFEVVVETPAGSSIDRTDGIMKGIEAAIGKIPEVTRVFTTIGVKGQYLSNVTDASIYVGLKPLKERLRSQTEIMQEARKLLKKHADLRIGVQNINLISGGGFKSTPFNLIIRGPELGRLDEYANVIIARLASIPGFVDVDTGQARRHPEVQVHIDRQKASDLGVKVEDIAASLRTMVGGEKVSLFRKDDDQYNVRLRLLPEYRKDKAVISELIVPSGTGRPVKLANITELTSGTSPAQIDRYAHERQVTVISNLYGKPLGTAIADAGTIVKNMGMPPEYSTAYIGRGKLMQEAFLNFVIAFVLSLLFIYMVLAAQFESFVHPVTIMASIFLAIPFGMLSLILAGNTLNIYSFMGMFVLIGVVKKNAILQIDYTNTLRSRGHDKFEAQMIANRVRLRPILMTTLAIIAGMLPLTLSKGDGSSSRASMAIVIVGGQAMCLFVTLVVIPVVYSVFDDAGAFIKGLKTPFRSKAEKSDIADVEPEP
ncbi:MAG: efflux RND transporter permease subunit [Deltaproteobacteria bacterium]|nr:efflux RND transporter permease subunit [Deltaproteobacteria bacterium]